MYVRARACFFNVYFVCACIAVCARARACGVCVWAGVCVREREVCACVRVFV